MNENEDNREKLTQLRKSTGMSMKQFAAYFGIPYRTYQDWEYGNRNMADYLLRLLAYYVKMEQLGNTSITHKEKN
ncbi:helix-turn-helix domain-containing protein [Ihubacter sp. mB4P-1]|uniref:helix-turn-helix domain-containing protein n=1 Tax=Ihubacter sp. mB4P-1 TaxID=3242370 RepID=UPI00192A1E65